MSHEDPNFMDIDDEVAVHEINLQLSELRKDKILPIVLPSLSNYRPTESIGIQPGTRAFLVVDTNFLISHLGFLNAIISVHAKSHGIVMIIPWIVIQELDGLKNARDTKPVNGSSHSQSLGVLARNAINFIHNCLEEKDSSLRGQRLQENLQKEAETNDDRILDCCIYLQTTTKLPTTLLSNDINLCVKAMIHDVQAISAKNRGEMPQFLEKVLSTQLMNRNVNGYATLPDHASNLAVDTYIQQYPSVDDDDMMIDEDYMLDLSTPIQHTVDQLPTSTDAHPASAPPDKFIVLTAAIINHLMQNLPQAMLHCYNLSLGSQDAVSYILGPKHQYPWKTLSEMVGLIYRHWLSVFETTAGLPRHAKDKLQETEMFVRNWELRSHAGIIKLYKVDVSRFLDGVDVLMQIVNVKEDMAGRKREKAILSEWRKLLEEL